MRPQQNAKTSCYDSGGVDRDCRNVVSAWMFGLSKVPRTVALWMAPWLSQAIRSSGRKKNGDVERMEQVQNDTAWRWNRFGARNHWAMGCRAVVGAGLTETIGRIVVGINLIVVMNKLGSKKQKHRASTRESVAQSIGSGMTTIREQSRHPLRIGLLENNCSIAITKGQ